jgi:hypothetical protein
MINIKVAMPVAKQVKPQQAKIKRALKTSALLLR